MANITNAKKRELAEQLYIYQGMRKKEIAEYLGVAQKTITQWSSKYNWDDLKGAQTLTRDNIIRNLYQQVVRIKEAARDEERPLTASETDQIYKLSYTIEKLDKKVTLPNVIMIFKDFIQWLMGMDADLARQLMDYQKKYLYKVADNEQS